MSDESNVFQRKLWIITMGEWPICKAHHSSLPCFYCSGDEEHILDDCIYSKASSPSSGWSLNFNSYALLTVERGGCEATGIKQMLKEVSWVSVMSFKHRNFKNQGDICLLPKLKGSSTLYLLFWYAIYILKSFRQFLLVVISLSNSMEEVKNWCSVI